MRSPMCEWRGLGKPFAHYAYPQPKIPYGYEAGKAKGVKSPCSEMRSLSSFETQLNEKPIPARKNAGHKALIVS